jgi:spore coat polysaccharide biosynthesis protein SpsF
MVAAVILVRMDSKRFPNKAFAELGGMKLIEHPIRALKKDGFFTPIIATTEREVDQPLVDLAQSNGIGVFRGSLEDVSKRVIDCLISKNVKEFYRINGDSPFLRLDLLKRGYDLFKEKNYDFVTNLYPRSFPYGVSLELFRADVFIENMNKVTDPFYKENITSYFYANIDRFKFGNISTDDGNNYSDIHLTVDTEKDLTRVQKMIDIDKFIFGKNIDEIVSIYNKVNF